MKLTNEQRKETIGRCIKATFSAREEKYLAMRAAFGDALYVLAFGDVEKIVNKLPPEWSYSSSHIEVYGVGYKRFHSETDKCPARMKLSKPRRTPPNCSSSLWNIKDDSHPLAEQSDAILKEHSALEAAKKALENDLTTLLYSATTLAKLEEVWPEGKAFFPVEVVRYPVPVPFDLAKKVTRTMGLKPVARAKK